MVTTIDRTRLSGIAQRLGNLGLVFILAWLFPSVGDAQHGSPRPDQLKLADGFQAELIYTVPEKYGSWVSLTTAPGGLIACDQYGKLYRVTPSDSKQPTQVQTIDVNLGRAQGLLWAFDSLYVVAHPGENQPAGLYRVTDEDRDGQLDTVRLLRELKGQGEHGPHAVILGPDKKSLYVCAGNHTQLPEVQTSRVPRHWREDQLLRRMWDPGGHAVGIQAPGGWICKTDPEGRSFELVSIGFRNQYDIAFDTAGELFTYDADMEWDIGTPWYRPTRVCHVTSGSEFGWRGGNGKWPTYYPDSVPPVIEIGPGSPTGIAFGTDSGFPPRYQKALFIADWSFGFIYAVHLQPHGGSFTGEAEVFCSAPALQVTDIAFRADDGAMYFAIGGRRTQSALYRITCAVPIAEDLLQKSPALDTAQRTRRELETWHLQRNSAEAVNQSWDYLDHQDRAVRYAARIAIEHQPVDTWMDRALSETRIQALLEATTALARCAPPEQLPKIVDALAKLDWDDLTEMQRLHLLRNYGLVLTRSDSPPARVIQAINERLAKRYPSPSILENRELSQLLVATQAENVVARTLELMERAATQEEQIHYAMCLRVATEGWSLKTRRQYLSWFADSGVFQGGHSFAGFLRNARDEFIKSIPPDQVSQLQSLIREPIQAQDPYRELRARPVVKQWKVDDLLPQIEKGLEHRDLENGKRMFALGQCFKCHRFEGSGGLVGPDLTGLSRRYTDRYLLETLIEPNKVISDQYQATVFMMNDGRMITGRVANLNGDVYMVQTDMIAPGKLTNVDRRQVEESRPSTVSMMPEDLLDHLSEDEILDLLAYLRSAEGGGGETAGDPRKPEN